MYPRVGYNSRWSFAGATLRGLSLRNEPRDRPVGSDMCSMSMGRKQGMQGRKDKGLPLPETNSQKNRDSQKAIHLPTIHSQGLC